MEHICPNCLQTNCDCSITRDELKNYGIIIKKEYTFNLDLCYKDYYRLGNGHPEELSESQRQSIVSLLLRIPISIAFDSNDNPYVVKVHDGVSI